SAASPFQPPLLSPHPQWAQPIAQYMQPPHAATATQPTMVPLHSTAVPPSVPMSQAHMEYPPPLFDSSRVPATPQYRHTTAVLPLLHPHTDPRSQRSGTTQAHTDVS